MFEIFGFISLRPKSKTQISYLLDDTDCTTPQPQFGRIISHGLWVKFFIEYCRSLKFLDIPIKYGNIICTMENHVRHYNQALSTVLPYTLNDTLAIQRAIDDVRDTIRLRNLQPMPFYKFENRSVEVKNVDDKEREL